MRRLLLRLYHRASIIIASVCIQYIYICIFLHDHVYDNITLWRCVVRHGSTWVDGVCVPHDHSPSPSPSIHVVFLIAEGEKRVTEELNRKTTDGHTSRIILQPIETNVSTLLLILFGIYSNFNRSFSYLSHVTLGYSKAGIRSRFQKVFHVTCTPVVDEKLVLDQQKLSALYAL